MKTLCCSYLTLIFCVATVFGQTKKYTEHKVSIGENITQIAAKYKVTPAAIYNLNPDSQKSIKVDMILLIPKSNGVKTKETTTQKANSHQVASGETFYSIAKKYGTTEAELGKLNPEAFKNGLKLGETISVPRSKNGISTEKIAPNNGAITTKAVKLPDYHLVVSGETIYSISKKYGISTTDITSRNPEVKEGLQNGMQLKINPNAKKANTIVKTSKENKKKNDEDFEINTNTPIKNIELKNYEVKPKETLYGLSKKTGLSEQQLTKLNPELKEGLKEGMILKLPLQIVTETVASDRNREVTDLTATLNTKKKKSLTLLLPFNVTKIESDTVNNINEKLKKDKFLNMTLDFYSGVLMAIDSAKTMNLNLDIKILDSEENKNGSGVANLLKENAIDKSDVIIGPFYQSNVEKTAELLSGSNAFIISPLSKETSKESPNLLQSMPNNEVVKNAMFDYMHSKNGNIVALIDIKKGTTKKYISEKHSDVKQIQQDETGNFTIGNITDQLVTDKINYVILESEKTGTILKVLNMLIGLSVNYQIHLVILEKNSTLDFEEIPLAKLAKLRLTFPSMYKENQSQEGAIFEKKYKQKYKVTPNQYAIRGFDVTFDTMLRLSQDQDFISSINKETTSQHENRFDYEKQVSGAYMNKGVYILYYDTDLTVKEAN
jgi:LysM repeat protein